MSITICQSRTEADERKEQVRGLAPGANWKTRTIEGVQSLSVELLHSIQNDPANILMRPASDLDGAPDEAVVLIMWIETVE